MAPRRQLDLVGLEDIAERLGQKPATVRQWSWRGWPGAESPTVLATISKRIAVYEWPDVERWARESGRLPGAQTPREQGANQAPGRRSRNATRTGDTK